MSYQDTVNEMLRDAARGLAEQVKRSKERHAVSDQIDSGKMPVDGFYICRLMQDTGGEVTRYVRVLDGRTYLPSGHEVLSDACSYFRPVRTFELCGAWPGIAGDELDALRTANAELLERVIVLNAYLEIIHNAGDAMENLIPDILAAEAWRKAKEEKP